MANPTAEPPWQDTMAADLLKKLYGPKGLSRSTKIFHYSLGNANGLKQLLETVADSLL